MYFILNGCLFNLVAFLSFTSYCRICEDFGFLDPVRCAVGSEIWGLKDVPEIEIVHTFCSTKVFQ